MKRRLVQGFAALVVLAIAMIGAIAVLQEDYDLNTRVTISASPEKVWRVLNDFEKYPEWNPHLRAVDGQPQPNSRTRFKEIFTDGGEVVRQIGMKSMAINYEFIWEADMVPIPRMLTAKRKLIMTASEQGATNLRHEIEFRGWLSGPLSQQMFSRYALSMAAMNDALTKRVAQPQ